MVQVCCCEHTALNMPSVEIPSLLCMQGTVICAAPQHLEEADERFGVSEAELNSHAISLEAQVGRLIAEAANLEDENCWMNAQLKDTQSDKWYLEIAKLAWRIEWHIWQPPLCRHVQALNAIIVFCTQRLSVHVGCASRQQG